MSWMSELLVHFEILKEIQSSNFIDLPKQNIDLNVWNF